MAVLAGPAARGQCKIQLTQPPDIVRQSAARQNAAARDRPGHGRRLDAFHDRRSSNLRRQAFGNREFRLPSGLSGIAIIVGSMLKVVGDVTERALAVTAGRR